MELIRVTSENIEKEHICCAISKESDPQVVSKKAWLRERFDEGLVFLKGNVRGKCFIEYLPAEYAWAPIEAEGDMYIRGMETPICFLTNAYGTARKKAGKVSVSCRLLKRCLFCLIRII